VTVLVGGVYKTTTAASATAHGWTITGEGALRKYEALYTDKSPYDLDITTPGTLVHSISWTDANYAAPSGVAAAIVAETSQLMLEGSMTFHSKTLPAESWMGSCIEFIDPPTEWTDGVAVVNSVVTDFASNTVTIGFGPGGTLGVQDWIDLLTRCRNRPSGNAYRVVSGQIASPLGAYNAIPDEVLESASMPEGYEEILLTLSQTGSTFDRLVLVKTPPAE